MSTPADGGPAFPNLGEIFLDGPQGRAPQSAWGMHGDKGMSLRDWFARNVPHDEVCEMTYKHLSRQAQERLAGMEKPALDGTLRNEAAVERQIQMMVFHARVNAALRYISADAMLAARQRKEES